MVYCHNIAFAMLGYPITDRRTTFLRRFDPGGFRAGQRLVQWVRTELVAAAEIAERTDKGKLRQASFKGLREGKQPLEVVRERT